MTITLRSQGAVACGTANVASINPGFIRLETVRKIYNKVFVKNIL